jgi:hypothetical protein
MFRLGPSVPFEGYKLGHIKAVEEGENSTFESKDTLEKFSLHIESASLCPLKSEHIVQPPSSSFFDGEPHCLSYMTLPLVED